MKPLIRNLIFILLLTGQSPLFCQNASRSQTTWPVGCKTPAGYIQPADVAPLMTSRWGQGCFFNTGCPVDTASHATCLHAPAGSGATAMAQVMKFYQYPAHGTGEHGYPHPRYGIQYANFGMTNYNWSAMPDTLVAGHDDLATLIYQCGVAQDMNYGPDLSTSAPDAVDSAFVKYFGYPGTASWKSRSDYNSAEWIAMLKTELDASHPLMFSGTDSLGSVQHFFICDGYNGEDLFHINWGWNGAHDGYFPLDNLRPGTVSYSFNQRALFNLAPSVPVPGDLVMDFESVPDFSLTFGDWTVNDADKHDTYGITDHTFPHQMEPMAFLCFNPSQVTPSMASVQAIQPHGGQRFGACFSSNPPSNSDWFISPQVQMGSNGSFSFWVKSYNDKYGLDSYTVAVSTTDNDPGSFTTISGSQPLQATTSWAKRTLNLSAYNGQKIYLAIHCVSDNNFLMMIDDLLIKPQSSSTLTADFTADKTSVRVGEAVNFTDLSSGGPVTWAWQFSGATPATSGQQNPTGIKYSTPGYYSVSLKVSNGTASDSVTKTAYISVAGYTTFISLDFESLSDFTTNFNPWTLIDVKGGNTYGIQDVSFPNNYLPMAYICFNPDQTTPPLVNMQAHAGLRLGCCFSTTPPLNPNDKWLISPRMSLGLNPQIEFWVKTYNNQFGDERYNVSVSTGELAPAAFSPLTAQPESAPTEWTKKTYSLSNYTNQDVYIGIQCVTNDGFIFMVDDIAITSSLGVSDENSLNGLTVFPNPATGYVYLGGIPPNNDPVSVDMTGLAGEKIASWHEIPVSGRITLDIQNIQPGVYFLHVKKGSHETVRKVFIINP